MSGSVISSNTSVKIAGAVTAVNSIPLGVWTTFYNVPANEYLEILLAYVPNSLMKCRILYPSGLALELITGGPTTYHTNGTANRVYASPGSSVQFYRDINGAGQNCVLEGIRFSNSP